MESCCLAPAPWSAHPGLCQAPRPLPGSDFHWPAFLSRSDRRIASLTLSVSPFLNSAQLCRCLFMSLITYGTGSVEFCLRVYSQHPCRSCIKQTKEQINSRLEKTQSESLGESRAGSLIYTWKQNKPSIMEGGPCDQLMRHKSRNRKTSVITTSSNQMPAKTFSGWQVILKTQGSGRRKENPINQHDRDPDVTVHLP